MKTLHKTIKKQWFDMIVAGIKKHEYLEIKPYWASRLINWSEYPKEDRDDHKNFADDICHDLASFPAKDVLNSYWSQFKSFGIVHAFNGGSPCADYPNVKWEHLGIEIGEGKPEWGAEVGKKYFILKIGKILELKEAL